MHWLLVVLGLCQVFTGGVNAEETLTVYQGLKSKDFRLDYTDGQGDYNKLVNINVMEGLVTLGANSEVVPAQAERWELNEDQREVVFHLREDALWSNGEPVIAQDFVTAWRNLVDLKNNRRMNGLLFLVENYSEIREGKLPPYELGVSAVGDKELHVSLEGSAELFLKVLPHHPMAPVYSKDVSRTPNNDSWSVEDGKLYNGAYLPSEYRKEGVLELVKNPKYYGFNGLGFSKVVWKRGLGNGEIINAVITGEADQIVSNVSYQENWVKQYASEYLIEGRTPVLEYLVFNNSYYINKYDAVRQAINMALFRNRLRNSGDKGRIPLFRMNVDAMYHHEKLPFPAWIRWEKERRLRVARELVEKSGFTKESPFVLEMISMRNSKKDKTLHQSMSFMLSKINVVLEVKVLDLEIYYKALRKGEYSSAIIGWIKDFDDAYSHLGLLDSNHSFYANKLGSPEIDEALRSAVKVDDSIEREKRYLEIERMNQLGNFIIPLTARKRLRAARADIINPGAGYANFGIRWMKRKAAAE